MHAIAVAVAENLKLDMPGTLQIFFYQYMLIIETGFGFAFARGQCVEKFSGGIHCTHALATTTCSGFDKHRIANLVGLLLEKFRRLIVAVVARGERHTGFFHQFLGFGFAAHRPYRRHRRTNKNDATSGAGLGEIFVFGQKSVARMHRLRAGSLGCRNDFFCHQIGGFRCRWAYANRLIGKSDVPRTGIGLGIHRHRADTHASRRLDHAAGNLAAIGNQDFAKHHLPRDSNQRHRHNARCA